MPTETTTAQKAMAKRDDINLNEPALYINRETSWVEFNRRVLEEALNTRHPLLERVKFLAIFYSNLDEFFMIRVSGLRRQLSAVATEAPPDGMKTAEQIEAIRSALKPMLTQASDLWHKELLPKLAEVDIHVLQYEDIKGKQRKLLRSYFEREIFPVLTPLAFDPGHPFPHISNLSMNLAVVIKDPKHGERFARLKVPATFPRLLAIPSEEKADKYEKLGLAEAAPTHYVWLEQVVAANLDLLFPGVEIVSAHPFRITRDADFEIEEDEADDLLASIEESVGQRQFGATIRLEVDKDMSDRIHEILVRNLRLARYQVYKMNGPLGGADLLELVRIERPELKDAPFLPALPSILSKEENIFTAIRQHNIFLYHPYDSFTPVVDFIRTAAHDPNVLAIKQTLYRVGPNSPIVKALLEARENDKQVAVLVELRARFDEENNIEWARALEAAGVHVVYGVVGLKTHGKVCLVVRREPDGITRYVHLGSGNYNPITARVYTDIGYFTCDPAIGADVSDLFNSLTGYAKKERYSKLLVAPGTMGQEILSRIDREIERHKKNGDGYIAFKLNALVDKDCIQSLYRASQAGVKVNLQVRAICGLRPGVKDVSENITVTSIVGRFLEHTRIFYFHNGGNSELFVGSADLMPRNLYRRVEVLFPIEDTRLRDIVRRDILEVHLRDNVQARRLLSDGSYERIKVKDKDPEINSQRIMLEKRGAWLNEE
jgi:polyphosphate kinase